MSTANHDRDKHTAAIVTALLLSVVMHVCFLIFFKDYKLTSAIGARVNALFGGQPAPMNVSRVDEQKEFSLDQLLNDGVDRRLSETEMRSEVDQLSRDSSTALTAPPPVAREDIKMPSREIAAGEIRPEDITPWEPRQQIAQITKRLADDELAVYQRREIADIERIPDAPDIVSSVDLASLSALTAPKAITGEALDEPLRPGSAIQTALLKPAAAISPTTSASALSPMGEDVRGKVRGVLTDEEKKELGRELEEQRKKSAALTKEELKAGGDRRKTRDEIDELKDAAEYVSLDDMLAVELETWRPRRDAKRLYFKLSVRPREDRPVEVIAKDIVFMMDVSGSLGEERMQRCRASLTRALGLLNAGDRFNIVAFRDVYSMCFPDWAEATSANISKANTFVSAMRSYGSTDLFASLQTLFRFPRNLSRPLIVFMVTDGIPTKGEVQSTKIIGEFSKMNAGVLSVYMFGVAQKANAYLIDMLTACNRGESTIVKGGRSDINAAFGRAYDGIRNPILADVNIAFDSASEAEVYPRDSANLYRDRPLTLYGSCPLDTRELVFQLRGLAGEKAYDSIIRIDVAKGRRGDEELRERWAKAKMFFLVSDFARNPRSDIMREMVKVHKEYDVMIPYEKELQ